MLVPIKMQMGQDIHLLWTCELLYRLSSGEVYLCLQPLCFPQARCIQRGFSSLSSQKECNPSQTGHRTQPAHMQTNTHIQIHTRTCTHTCTHVHTHACTHRYINIVSQVHLLYMFAFSCSGRCVKRIHGPNCDCLFCFAVRHHEHYPLLKLQKTKKTKNKT